MIFNILSETENKSHYKIHVLYTCKYTYTLNKYYNNKWSVCKTFQQNIELIKSNDNFVLTRKNIHIKNS